MRVLFVTQHSMTWFGGAEKVLETTVDYLIKERVDVSILNYILGDDALKPEEQVSPYCKYSNLLTVDKLIVWWGKPLLHILLFGWGKWVYRNGIKSLQKYFRKHGHYDAIIVFHFYLIPTIKEALRSVNEEAKIIYWDHGTIPSIMNAKTVKEKIKKRLLSKLLWVCLRSANMVFAISATIAEIIKTNNVNVDIRITYNPISTENIKIIKEPEFPVFLYIGRLFDYQKNVKFLLDMVSRIKELPWELVVYGDGPDLQMLKKHCNFLGLSNRVVWKGFEKKPLEKVKEASCLLLTSRWEGFPLVLAESLAAGLPVIAANCETGPSEIIVHGQNGFLYEPGNIEEGISYLRKIINKQSGLLPRKEIPKTVERFEEIRVMRKILSYIEE